MFIKSNQIHFEVVKESFLENVNVLTRYQFLSEQLAMEHYVKLHNKYESQTAEEQSRWCCRLDIRCRDGFNTISCFGYGFLTWNSERNPVFEEMLAKYKKNKEGG